MRYFFTFTFLLITTFGISQIDTRYVTPIFKDYNLYENIIYGESTPYKAGNYAAKQFYSLDFYEPANDPAITRPIILLFPDGDFLIENKEQEELVDLCKTLTSYGYTCACVNYRQGYDGSRRDGIQQAVYRGVQDGRAAIRYLLEHDRTFRINPEKIYVGGSRSGGIVALHTAFLDKDEVNSNFSSVSCLDCDGNPFEHDIKIAGVINIDGSINNPSIIANNRNIPILNLHIKGQKSVNNGLGKHASADLMQDYNGNFAPDKLHDLLDSLNYDTDYKELSKSDSFGFIEATEIEATSIANFLQSKISFISPIPTGKATACVSSISTFTVPYEKNCNYRWIVKNGTIIQQDNNTVDVKWNNKIGKGKVSVVKIDDSGINGLPSPFLVINITPQPTPDIEVEYMSDNTIKIKDKSEDANLYSVDFNYEGMTHMGKPQTIAMVTYEESGTYFLTQTVENGCGVATQSVPIDISTSFLYRTTNIKEAMQSIPALLQKGSNSFIKIDKLKNVKEFTIIVKDINDKVLSELVYTLEGNDIDLPIYTSTLEAGVYFVEFSSDSNILATKRIRVK